MNECKRCAATLRNPQALLCPLCQQYDQAVRDREEYMTINRELIENNRELLRLVKELRGELNTAYSRGYEAGMVDFERGDV